MSEHPFPWWDDHDRPANAGQTYPPEVLTVAELHALIRACSGTAPTGIRNRGLIAVMAGAGLRISEATALEPKDVDLRTGTVHVLRGKGAKRRAAGLDVAMGAHVERWLDHRRALGLRGGPLFCTLPGNRLSHNYIRAMLRRVAGRAGIDRRVHPHALRHSYAHQLMMKGVSVPVIQAQLGHEHLQTTSVYLGRIAPAEVIETVRAVDLWG